MKLVHRKHVAVHEDTPLTGCLHKSGQGLNVLSRLEEYLGLLFGFSGENITRLMGVTVCVWERKQSYYSSVGKLRNRCVRFWV